MNNEQLVQIYNTLNQIEVKGYENINRMFGVLLTIQECLNNPTITEQTE